MGRPVAYPVIDGLKECGKCHGIKSVSEFYWKRGGYVLWCKACHKAYGADWYKNNKSRHYASVVAWQSDPANKKALQKIQKRSNLKRVGFTNDLYVQRMEEQGGACVICHRSFSKELRPYADHNHNTKEPRGLLCGLCNWALERIESLPDWPERARAYLAKYAS